ncbi:MAG: nucleotidyltransferase domain-containing protein [Deltaproteobacteria bacterium]|nr:nucleotidyltransferase domain-containing protein [Deltaproteobacteria bacterium]
MTHINLSRIEKEIRSSIRASETSELDDITAIYIFGSTLSGQVTESSDIDLAFLLSYDAYKAEPVHSIQLPYLIAAKVGMRFNMETDVIILNSASLEIAHGIVTTGKCIYENNPDSRLTYEVSLKGMYFDFKPFLDELRLACISEI